MAERKWDFSHKTDSQVVPCEHCRQEIGIDFCNGIPVHVLSFMDGEPFEIVTCNRVNYYVQFDFKTGRVKVPKP